MLSFIKVLLDLMNTVWDHSNDEMDTRAEYLSTKKLLDN